MHPHDRHSLITALIRAEGEIGLVEMAERFGVSEMTIRRDLETLEAEGVLRRVLGGGAIATTHKAQEPRVISRALEESESKTHIAAAVVNRLQDGEAVYLDGGSTAIAVARELCGRGLHMTILTRSLLAALELADDPTVSVLLLGGTVKGTEMITLRTSLDHDLGEYNVDTYVMGISGVHPDRGLTDYDPEEASGKRLALNQADRTILAVDASKVGRVVLAHVAALDDVDIVVTDADSSDPVMSAFGPTVEIEYVVGRGGGALSAGDVT